MHAQVDVLPFMKNLALKRLEISLKKQILNITK